MTRFGALPLPGGGVEFRVFAPRAERVAAKVVAPRPGLFPLERRADGVFEGVARGLGPGADYFYALESEGATRERPDPVSRFQPHGVHGPSRVIDPGRFAWTDAGFEGIALEDFVIYELHAGTFTPEGTFEAAAGKLGYLRSLGVTAVEVMPVAEFPGARNWGYDGVHLYAPQSTYGGPDGLKALVDACHREGLAAVLDVVYNHLGPEGNYLSDYAPFFTDRYRTPWGAAVNFDDAGCDGVRRHFIENAVYWIEEFHFDALRLDAIHGIFDFGARHILEEIGAACHEAGRRRGRPALVIAESDLNDVRVIDPLAEGGFGLDAQWSDDFHHSMHTLLTGVRRGYFEDFGRLADLAKALAEGFVYDWRYSSYRRRRHGSSSARRPGRQFVICTQNHDQVANGSAGERHGSLLPLEKQKLAAAVLLTAPCLPLLFMGQEYGETAPFFYFTSHADPALSRAVSEGRRREFASFFEGRPFPDPQDPATFERSKLCWARLETEPHAALLRLYRDLLALRRSSRALSNCRKDLTRVEFDEEEGRLAVERGGPGGAAALLVCNLGIERAAGPGDAPPGFRLALDTAERRYGGPGGGGPLAPASARLFLRSER